MDDLVSVFLRGYSGLVGTQAGTHTIPLGGYEEYARRPWRIQDPDEEFYETATGEIRSRNDPWGGSSHHLDDIIRSITFHNNGSITFSNNGARAKSYAAVPVEDEKIDQKYMEALADSEKKLDSFLDEFTITDNT